MPATRSRRSGEGREKERIRERARGPVEPDARKRTADVWIALDGNSVPAARIRDGGKDAAASVMHKPLLALALLATLAVAGLTVHLEVRARLRSYELARGRETTLELAEARDAVRVRAAASWAPERVARMAERLRVERDLAAAASRDAALAQL